MQVIKNIKQMSSLSDKWRQEGKKIAFVPTMGYFHNGHLSLMRKGRLLGDVLVVSIFINPIQFGPKEDFKEYPRNFERDSALAQKEKVDVVFVPDEREMYPPGYQTFVEVTKLTQHLCGLSRPGHFKGVATVVAKLFNIVKPHFALFGLKDYQQYLVIKKMVEDLNFDVQIIGCPTVRESDGLAMSSRNEYLLPEQRGAALSLYKSLKMAQDLFETGEHNAKKIKAEIINFIKTFPYTQIDYVSICDPETLEEIDEIKDKALMALAVRVGKARLIDNLILEVRK